VLRAQTIQEGFTLIELLVATAVFAILGMLAYGGLNSVLSTQTHVTAEAERLKDLQFSFRYMQRDIEQMADRAVRDKFGDEHAALILGEDPLISLTHAGWRNPAGLTRSQLQRVAYDLEDGVLMRTAWSQLDGIDFEDIPQVRLLDEVTDIEIRILDNNGKWHEEWPSNDQDAGQGGTFPIAIEIELTAEPWDSIRRLIALAQ
jgi:general secretion pathway protein J